MMAVRHLLSLCVLLLINSVLSATINSNLTVSLKDFNGQQVTLPQVNTIRFECTSGGSELDNLRWTGDIGECTMNGTNNYLLCSPQSTSSDSVTCTYSNAQQDNVTYSLNVTIDNDVTVFVDSNFRYRSPMTSQVLALSAENAAAVNVPVTITCIPVRNGSVTTIVTWRYRPTLPNGPNQTLEAGEFKGVTVSFADVTGDMGTVTNGQLNLNRQSSDIAGHYECSVNGASEVYTDTLYWGPYFNEFDFANVSAIERHDAVLPCEGLTFPGYPVVWEMCEREKNTSCSCNDPKRIERGGRFEFIDNEAKAGIFPPDNTLVIRNVSFDDRRCYRCTVDNSVTTKTHYIFLRIRDDLLVLWPILILVVEGLIVVLFIVGHILYQRWRDGRKPPKRSTDGPSADFHNLLPDESVPLDQRTSNDNSFGMRKRTDVTSTASFKDTLSSDL